MHRIFHSLCALALVSSASTALAATNIIPTATQSVSINRGHGVLRAGSPWLPGSTPSNAATVTDGVFAPEGQQWNNGSFWWDEDASVDATQMFFTIQLDASYTIDRFIVQADDNEEYVVDYWNGIAFVALEDFPGVGLQTRDSGTIPPITTDKLRLSARLGDKYYSISEFQAFGTPAVPEPATWAMMLIGFGFAGSALRRRRGKAALDIHCATA